ncbi:MAG: hypothetical protein GC138_07285 [Gammaproteobacteria bacterium]|nr:hypothetical protein [Gammaproteobacteria bacterium]
MQQDGQWSLSYHLDMGDSGEVGVIRHHRGETKVQRVDLISGDGDNQVFIGLDDEGRCLMTERGTGEITRNDAFLATSRADYAYPDLRQDRLWFVSDGDPKTGCDAATCGDQGSSVTIVSRGGAGAEVLKTLCVGKGHHVTAFVYPDQNHGDFAPKAYVSNLVSGSISVVGNDPSDASTYLQIIKTINLLEADRDPESGPDGDNNAFPHGKVYSPVTGRVYCLNNGYGTIAVIDPVTDEIENRLTLKQSSNLLLSPDGRYLVGKGADRKTDPDHVIGVLTLIDVASGETVCKLDLPDIYPSTYRFNPAGDRLYVTSAATGKGVQRDNIRKDVVQVYDVGSFPKLELIREIEVGVADCSRRPIGFLAGAIGDEQRVFVPNPTDGTLTMLAGANDSPQITLRISDKPITEFSFSIWCKDISAC